MDVALKHQRAIAYKTLRMTPAMARVMGGMDFEEAYQLIFKTDLKQRLAQLIAEYGPSPAFLSWELGTYGWANPKELFDML